MPLDSSHHVDADDSWKLFFSRLAIRSVSAAICAVTFMRLGARARATDKDAETPRTPR
jgi:hypothetical protein